MTDTPTTINLYGIEPADMPQEHADLVAKTLGLRGAERWDCGHDYGWWMPQGKLIVTRLRQDAKHANVRCVTTSELVELIFTEGARLRAEVEALREQVERLQRDCGEAYQVVGVGMLGEPAPYTEDDVVRALDNLSAAAEGRGRPHDDLLPWPKPNIERAAIDAARAEGATHG